MNNKTVYRSKYILLLLPIGPIKTEEGVGGDPGKGFTYYVLINLITLLNNQNSHGRVNIIIPIIYIKETQV